jgi:hypothetical protein
MNNRWQEEYITCFVIFGLLIAFSVFILRQYFYTSEKALDVINAAILFWTGVVIAIYTGVTYKLWAESQHQTELGLRPFVILDVVYDGADHNERYKTYVRNLGNGTAINVNICDVKEDSTHTTYHFPQPVPILTAGANLKVECRHITSRGPGDTLILSLRNLYYPHNQETLVVRIEFKNIEGQVYYVEQTIVPRDVQFLFGKA